MNGGGHLSMVMYQSTSASETCLAAGVLRALAGMVKSPTSNCQCRHDPKNKSVLCSESDVKEPGNAIGSFLSFPDRERNANAHNHCCEMTAAVAVHLFSIFESNANVVSEVPSLTRREIERNAIQDKLLNLRSLIAEIRSLEAM